MRETLFKVLPNTLALAFSAMLIAIGVGLPIGFFAAYNHNSWIDRLLMVVAVLGVSIPQFWLGLILILEILYARSGIMGLFEKKNKYE